MIHILVFLTLDLTVARPRGGYGFGATTGYPHSGYVKPVYSIEDAYDCIYNPDIDLFDEKRIHRDSIGYGFRQLNIEVIPLAESGNACIGEECNTLECTDDNCISAHCEAE